MRSTKFLPYLIVLETLLTPIQLRSADEDVEKHLERLRSDEDYLGKIVEKPDGAAERKAVLQYVRTKNGAHDRFAVAEVCRHDVQLTVRVCTRDRNRSVLCESTRLQGKPHRSIGGRNHPSCRTNRKGGRGALLARAGRETWTRITDIAASEPVRSLCSAWV